MRRKFPLRKYVLLLAVTASAFALRALLRPHAAHAASNNVQLGAQLVAMGNQKGAIACARCHGYDGASDGSGAFPILSGQSAFYLAEQLRRFASGARQNAVMSSIAKNLTDEEIQNVSAYYASVKPTLSFTRQGPADLVSRGQYIATEGDLKNRVEGCINCHGPNGTGEAPAVPFLSGQHRHYIELQIKMFRRGYRSSSQMGPVGHHLSDEDAAAVAAYFDQLSLPSAK